MAEVYRFTEVPPEANGWDAIRKERLMRAGVFNWFMQCREHAQNSQEGCFSCIHAETHNAVIWREIAEEKGWLVDGEPAGDVPLCTPQS